MGVDRISSRSAPTTLLAAITKTIHLQQKSVQKQIAKLTTVLPHRLVFPREGASPKYDDAALESDPRRAAVTLYVVRAVFAKVTAVWVMAISANRPHPSR